MTDVSKESSPREERFEYDDCATYVDQERFHLLCVTLQPAIRVKGVAVLTEQSRIPVVNPRVHAQNNLLSKMSNHSAWNSRNTDAFGKISASNSHSAFRDNTGKRTGNSAVIPIDFFYLYDSY